MRFDRCKEKRCCWMSGKSFAPRVVGVEVSQMGAKLEQGNGCVAVEVEANWAMTVGSEVGLG